MLDRLTIERLGADQTPVLIALSGGGDSVALMHLLAENLGPQRLHAAIVDHALRAGSANDAARAKSFADALGINARILTLSWGEGVNRAQGAARDARYAALCQAARELGAHTIVTGHTRDDQAETVLLRASRGSLWRGLAGMRSTSPVPIWPQGRGLFIARPLLGARRQDLRGWLEARGAAWIEDPSNTNPDYARVRARTALSELAATGLDPMRLATLAETLAPRARALDQAALALIQTVARFEAGAITLTRAAWSDAAAAIRARVLWALITAAGAHQRGPSPEQLAGAEAAIIRGETTTLSGALIRVSARDIRLSRDHGALAGRADGVTPLAPLILPPNVETIWDARLALTTPEPGWSVLAENGAPVLMRGDERGSAALARPRWLLEERVRHLLD